MTPQLSSRILVVLSITLGVAVTALAVSGSGAIGFVVSTGGLVLGLLWVTRSHFMNPRD